MKGWKVLLVLAIVGMFVMPMMPAKSLENKTKYDEIKLFVPVAEYRVGGNCGITIEILPEKICKIYRIEIDLKDVENNFEKRVMNDIKAPAHFYINDKDCVDLSFVDFGQDFAIVDGNTVTIHLTNVEGDFVKVKLYTDNGILYKEISLEPVPRVEVKKSLPIDTTCVITHPDGEKIEKEKDNIRGFYFNWVFEPPYPWGWKDADPYNYINYVNVNPYNGEFDLYCPGVYMTTIEEECGVSDSYPWTARIPPFDCFTDGLQHRYMLREVREGLVDMYLLH